MLTTPDPHTAAYDESAPASSPTTISASEPESGHAAPIRVALMSCAHTHARSYAAILSRNPEVELVVTDPDGFGDVDGPVVLDSHEAAWHYWPEGPDAIVVTSANAHHRDLVLEAAARGVHVLCEKPLATTVADAEQMIEACEQAGVVLMTAYPVHFAPAVQALRQAAEQGTLGQIVGVTGTNNGKMPTDRQWFSDPALAGGGALVDHTVHVAQILDSILGMPERVYAVTNGALYPQRTNQEAETGGLVTLTYPGGITATIDCSWSMPSDAPTWGGLTVQVVGTGGQLQIDPFAPHVGGFGQWLAYGTDLDSLLIAEFLEAVRTGQVREPSGQVGLRTVAVVDAAQQSVRTGQPVAVAPIAAEAQP